MPDFDPDAFQEPAPALVQLLRGLPLGGIVTLPSGTTVKSVGMNQGPGRVRRYQVLVKGQTPDGMVARTNTHASALDAARSALQRGGKK